MALSPAVAFSHIDNIIASRCNSIITSGTSLRYKIKPEGYYDIVDVDGDRMSLRSLLDPPAPRREVEAMPNEEEEESSKNKARESHNEVRKSVASRARSSTGTGTGTSTRAMTQRSSPIIELRSLQDYHRHVLHDPNQLCIIRFSAPWCKVCRSTNVAWERMAMKIDKQMNSSSIPNNSSSSSVNSDSNISSSGSTNNPCNNRVKFLSVNLDPKDESVAELKDMLQIQRVPQGILHHPTKGVFGRKVDLNRSNLSMLRKRLEKYLGDVDEDGEMEWI